MKETSEQFWERESRYIGERYHEFFRSIEEINCPFCGVKSGKVRTNGNGYYRCLGKCNSEFFLAWNEEELKGEKE